MNFLTGLVAIFNTIKELLDFIFSKVQESKNEKEKTNVDKLKEKIEKDLEDGNLKEINDKIKNDYSKSDKLKM